MKQTVLITGGSGFIGSHIVDLLLKNNYKIVILERLEANLGRLKEQLGQIKVYYSTEEGIVKIFSENKIDCVIHLATRYIKAHQGIKDLESIIDTNVKLPSQLLELCALNKVKYFINTGTFFEYKSSFKPLKETDEKLAYNLYAASKLAFEEILKYYAKSGGIKVFDFKLFAPFGDRDNEKLLAFLVKTLNSGETVDFSGGEQTWNFTYVKDIALAYLAALENLDSGDHYELINVGSENVVSIKTMAEKLEKIAGKKFNINWGAKPYIDNEIMYANCDNSKLKKLLGWKERYGLDDGLVATYKYFSQRS